MNELCFMEQCQEGPRTMERDRDNQLWVHEPVVGVYFQQRSKLLSSTPQFQQLLKPGRRLSRTGKCVCHRMSVKNPPSVGCFLPQIAIACAYVQTATRLWCVCEGPAAVGPWAGRAKSHQARRTHSFSFFLSTRAGGSSINSTSTCALNARSRQPKLTTLTDWQESQFPGHFLGNKG